MPIDDTPTAQAIEREIAAIQDGFERLLDMGVPGLRMDLIIDHLRNKYETQEQHNTISDTIVIESLQYSDSVTR